MLWVYEMTYNTQKKICIFVMKFIDNPQGLFRFFTASC